MLGTTTIVFPGLVAPVGPYKVRNAVLLVRSRRRLRVGTPCLSVSVLLRSCLSNGRCLVGPRLADRLVGRPVDRLVVVGVGLVVLMKV